MFERQGRSKDYTESERGEEKRRRTHVNVDRPRQRQLARHRHLPSKVSGLSTYQVLGIVGVWLTFKSHSWHVDSCLGNDRDFEGGEEESCVGGL